MEEETGRRGKREVQKGQHGVGHAPEVNGHAGGGAKGGTVQLRPILPGGDGATAESAPDADTIVETT